MTMDKTYIHLNLEFWDARCGRDILGQIIQLKSEWYMLTEEIKVHSPETMHLTGEEMGEWSLDLTLGLMVQPGDYLSTPWNIWLNEATTRFLDDVRTFVRVKEAVRNLDSLNAEPYQDKEF